jgi:hypothetical protein
MLTTAADFIIANWYATLCMIAAAINFRIGEQRFLSFTIMMFAALCWLINDDVKRMGEYFYLIWPSFELLMILFIFLGFKVLGYKINLHVVIACIASCYFIAVNMLRYIDRYYGDNVLAPYFKPMILLTYLIYSTVIISPMIGLIMVRVSSRLKGFNNDISSIIYRIGCVCMHGYIRR